MGNIRLSYFSNGSSPEILAENNFYPFGLKHEGNNYIYANPAYNYDYNGKEVQIETGMLDYGWRQYMPDLGRWTGMDMLSEIYQSSSPYAYVMNNPVMLTDPDGRKMTSPQPLEGIPGAGIPSGGGGIMNYYASGGKPGGYTGNVWEGITAVGKDLGVFGGTMGALTAGIGDGQAVQGKLSLGERSWTNTGYGFKSRTKCCHWI